MGPARTPRPIDGQAPDLQSAGEWDRILEAVGAAALMIAIEARMGPRLAQRYRPEDIFQDAVLSAWQRRAELRWQGLRAFRNWLLSIIDSRLRDLADYEGRLKRGGEFGHVLMSEVEARSTGEGLVDPGFFTTTPSKIAMLREQAAAIRAALDNLPDDEREVVRLRLIEQKSAEQVAALLGLGIAAVRHRHRKGCERYRRLLERGHTPRANNESPGRITSSD